MVYAPAKERRKGYGNGKEVRERERGLRARKPGRDWRKVVTRGVSEEWRKTPLLTRNLVVEDIVGGESSSESRAREEELVFNV